MATSIRPALATAASTARSTEASSVTSNSRTYIGSDSFSANERISEAFLALRPPGSRIVAKTVCPLRARVSVNSLPKPVLEPVIRTTCWEFMIDASFSCYRESRLMPETKQVVASAQRFVDVASVRYKTGLDPYLNVFTAQAILLANQQTVIMLRVQQMTSSVQLIESLGGGWDVDQLPTEQQVQAKRRDGSS